MEKTIDIDGIPVHYDDRGPASADEIVMIVHGWGCNTTTVESITRILEKKMRVISVDLPGHGKTPEPPSIWGVEEFTRLIEKMIGELGIARLSYLGHSFGGRIGILMSSRNDFIDKLVLVDAAGIKPHRTCRYYMKVYTYKTLKHLLPAVCGKKRGNRLLDKYRGKAGSSDYNSSTPIMRGILSKCVNEDLKHVMPSIKAPTLLIWGAEDTATPLSDAKTMEKLIPDVGLVSFEGCGHYSFLDNPGGFAAVLRSFFKL